MKKIILSFVFALSLLTISPLAQAGVPSVEAYLFCEDSYDISYPYSLDELADKFDNKGGHWIEKDYQSKSGHTVKSNLILPVLEAIKYEFDTLKFGKRVIYAGGTDGIDAKQKEEIEKTCGYSVDSDWYAKEFSKWHQGIKYTLAPENLYIFPTSDIDHYLLPERNSYKKYSCQPKPYLSTNGDWTVFHTNDYSWLCNLHPYHNEAIVYFLFYSGTIIIFLIPVGAFLIFIYFLRILVRKISKHVLIKKHKNMKSVFAFLITLFFILLCGCIIYSTFFTKNKPSENSSKIENVLTKKSNTLIVSGQYQYTGSETGGHMPNVFFISLDEDSIAKMPIGDSNKNHFLLINNHEELLSEMGIDKKYDSEGNIKIEVDNLKIFDSTPPSTFNISADFVKMH